MAFFFLDVIYTAQQEGFHEARATWAPWSHFCTVLRVVRVAKIFLMHLLGAAGSVWCWLPRTESGNLKNDDACNATWVCGREREGLGGREDAGGCHWALRSIQETPENLLSSHPHSDPAGYLLLFSSWRRGKWGFVVKAFAVFYIYDVSHMEGRIQLQSLKEPVNLVEITWFLASTYDFR